MFERLIFHPLWLGVFQFCSVMLTRPFSCTAWVFSCLSLRTWPDNKVGESPVGFHRTLLILDQHWILKHFVLEILFRRVYEKKSQGRPAKFVPEYDAPVLYGHFFIFCSQIQLNNLRSGFHFSWCFTSTLPGESKEILVHLCYFRKK